MEDPLGKILAVISTLITIVFLVILVPEWYTTNRDTDALIDRAQVAADAADMLDYVNQLRANMARLGMTKGSTALIFKTPANDMGLLYKSVERIASRLEQVKQLPQDQTAYQVALDDLRGTLRELRNPTDGWMWVSYLWWMLIVAGGFWIFTWLAIELYW